MSLSLAACDQSQPGGSDMAESEQGRPLVIASNYPLYFFASQIAGNTVEIVLPDIVEDPANWKPDSAAIEQMQAANLILLVGAGYESWLQWASLPDGLMLDTSSAFRDQLIPLEQETVHQHGPAGEHSHIGVAFTVWLDPELAIEQAKAIGQALSKLSPKNAAVYQEKFLRLSERLMELDGQLQQAFNKLGNQPLLFSHPVYQYLERRYELNGVSVHWEPEEPPGNSALIELGEILRKHPAKLMIWEDETLAATASQLKNFGVAVVPFHTVSNVPPDGDFFDVMAANIQRLSWQ